MNANEIRALAQRMMDRIGDNSPSIAELQVLMIIEMTAQMAETNEILRKLKS